MRIITFTLVLVGLNLRSTLQMVIIKGSDESLSETNGLDRNIESPEVITHVRGRTGSSSENPTKTTVPPWDLLSLSTAEARLPFSTAMKDKRCSRHEVVGATHDVTLSLTRRDVSTEKFKAQCERCRKLPLCQKNVNKCPRCKKICDLSVSSTPLPKTVPISDGEINNKRKTKFSEVTTNTLGETPTLTSRFGDELTRSDSSFLYYTVGSVEPGHMMNFLKRVLDLKEKDINRLIIVAQSNLGDNKNVKSSKILDLAKVFNTDDNAPMIYSPGEKNLENREQLFEKLNSDVNKEIEEKKKELNGDQLSRDEINNIIDRLIKDNGFVSQPVNITEDPSLQQVETETRCSLDDEIEEEPEVVPVQDQVISPMLPTRSKDIRPLEDTPKANNPSVIQDTPNILRLTDIENLPDDRFAANNNIIKPKSNPKFENKRPFSETGQQILKDIENTFLGQNEPDSNIPASSKPNIASDNKIKRVNSLLRNEHGSSEETGPSNSNSVLDKSDPLTRAPVRDNLEQNIFKIVEDSFKIAANNQRNVPQNLIEGLEETENLPVFTENDFNNNLGQANNENILREIERLQNEAISDNSADLKTQELRESQIDGRTVSGVDNNDLAETTQFPESSQIATADIENKSQHPMQNTKIDEHTISENINKDVLKDPNLENRAQFSDETVDDSKEYLHSFGSLVPISKSNDENEDSHLKKVYFVGKGIKLPLQMYEDKDGIMKLRVDTEKLCHCKNLNCTRKHTDSYESEETKVSAENLQISDDVENSKQRTNVNFGKENGKYLTLMDGLTDSLHLQTENAYKYKRSPRIDLQNESAMVLKDSLVKTIPNREHEQQSSKIIKLNEKYNFEKTEEKLEGKLQKLTKDVKKFHSDSKNLLNKGTIALLQNVETTKNVEKMIDLASAVLSWIKTATTKHLKNNNSFNVNKITQ